MLLSRLAGVRSAGQGRWVALCPGHPDRNPSLSIRLVDDKLLLHCFAGCRTDAVLKAIGLSWRDLYSRASKPQSASIPRRPTLASKQPLSQDREKWERWWSAAVPGHPLLKAYLQARGLELEPPPTLRLATWGEKRFMVARVEGLQGALLGMHLTELLPDGRGRLGKRLTKGSHPLGGAIRLFGTQVGRPLALAEGIETALAIRQATGWPTWACVSAVGLAGVELPAEVCEVVICADHDPAGLEAAQNLAGRLLAEGRKVRLAAPPKAGEDWLDVIAGGTT